MRLRCRIGTVFGLLVVPLVCSKRASASGLPASSSGVPAASSTCSRPSRNPNALAATLAASAASMAVAEPSWSRRETRRSSSSAASSATLSAGFSGAAAARRAATATKATISAGPLAATRATRSPSLHADLGQRQAARSRARCSPAYDREAPDSGTTSAGWLSDRVISWRRVAGSVTVIYSALSHGTTPRPPWLPWGVASLQPGAVGNFPWEWLKLRLFAVMGSGARHPVLRPSSGDRRLAAPGRFPEISFRSSDGRAARALPAGAATQPGQPSHDASRERRYGRGRVPARRRCRRDRVRRRADAYGNGGRRLRGERPAPVLRL